MAHRNRWFTELKNGGSFHGELLNKQMLNHTGFWAPSRLVSWVITGLSVGLMVMGF